MPKVWARPLSFGVFRYWLSLNKLTWFEIRQRLGATDFLGYDTERAEGQIRAIVVEGYTDVIGFARAELPRAVATCGTALTEEHVRILKRFTRNVCGIGVVAAPPGRVACSRNDCLVGAGRDSDTSNTACCVPASPSTTSGRDTNSATLSPVPRISMMTPSPNEGCSTSSPDWRPLPCCATER